MLETAQNVLQAQNSGGTAQSGRISAPVSAKSRIEDNLSKAAQGVSDTGFDAAMAYVQTQNAAPEDDGFGFGDIVDMVNPLHHIPLVGMIYREATGDEIDPMAQILGSAAYGGFAGAASGIANAIVQEETGRDIGGNFVAMMQGEAAPLPARRSKDKNNPQERLGQMMSAPLMNPQPALGNHPDVASGNGHVPQARPQIVSPYGYTTDW